jgi:uncharacterized protein (TIGR00730 family)
MQKKIPIKAITVYAASGSKIPPLYFQAARDLGEQMAALGITCINGAGNSGLMAELTDAVLEKGGNVSGIIPQFMIKRGWLHKGIRNLTVTPDMHTRKQKMAQMSDACIALPGGIGTLEELLEIMTWKQLGLYPKPVIILNIGGFYDLLNALLQKLDAEHFLPHKTVGIYALADTPKEALNLIIEQKKQQFDNIL